MRIIFATLVLLLFVDPNNAQNFGAKLDDLLVKGWEPFSAQWVAKFPFTDQGRTQEMTGYTTFLRKSGGLAYCFRSLAVPSLGDCYILREAGH
jgi:hypothetical protein